LSNKVFYPIAKGSEVNIPQLCLEQLRGNSANYMTIDSELEEVLFFHLQSF